MNITREIWSVTFQCLPKRIDEFWLHFGMGFVAVAPLAFYILAFLLAGKQEARVLQRKLNLRFIKSNLRGHQVTLTELFYFHREQICRSICSEFYTQ